MKLISTLFLLSTGAALSLGSRSFSSPGRWSFANVKQRWRSSASPEELVRMLPVKVLVPMMKTGTGLPPDAAPYRTYTIHSVQKAPRVQPQQKPFTCQDAVMAAYTLLRSHINEKIGRKYTIAPSEALANRRRFGMPTGLRNRFRSADQFFAQMFPVPTLPPAAAAQAATSTRCHAVYKEASPLSISCSPNDSSSGTSGGGGFRCLTAVTLSKRYWTTQTPTLYQQFFRHFDAYFTPSLSASERFRNVFPRKSTRVAAEADQVPPGIIALVRLAIGQALAPPTTTGEGNSEHALAQNHPVASATHQPKKGVVFDPIAALDSSLYSEIDLSTTLYRVFARILVALGASEPTMRQWIETHTPKVDSNDFLLQPSMFSDKSMDLKAVNVLSDKLGKELKSGGTFANTAMAWATQIARGILSALLSIFKNRLPEAVARLKKQYGGAFNMMYTHLTLFFGHLNQVALGRVAPGASVGPDVQSMLKFIEYWQTNK